MSATLKFQYENESVEIAGNAEAAKALASVKVGDIVQAASETNAVIGRVASISVSGNQAAASKTYKLGRIQQPLKRRAGKRTTHVGATIYANEKPYTVHDVGVISIYTSQPKFQFEGVMIENPSVFAAIEVFSDGDAYIDFYINEPQ